MDVREKLRQHINTGDNCIGQFDPAAGLHEEAIDLLRSRDKAGQNYLTQWTDICNIVFQTDESVIQPGKTERLLCLCDILLT
jgi:hypothetical protein